VTLRTEILAWIMNNGGHEDEAVLVNVFGQGAIDEVLSLRQLRVIRRRRRSCGTIYYEVTKIWGRTKGSSIE
jgi:hypothetical protein